MRDLTLLRYLFFGINCNIDIVREQAEILICGVFFSTLLCKTPVSRHRQYTDWGKLKKWKGLERNKFSIFFNIWNSLTLKLFIKENSYDSKTLVCHLPSSSPHLSNLPCSSLYFIQSLHSSLYNLLFPWQQQPQLIQLLKCMFLLCVLLYVWYNYYFFHSSNFNVLNFSIYLFWVSVLLVSLPCLLISRMAGRKEVSAHVMGSLV